MIGAAEFKPIPERLAKTILRVIGLPPGFCGALTLNYFRGGITKTQVAVTLKGEKSTDSSIPS